MTKVNRELRGGATQSPRSIESRPGAERRKVIRYAATEVPVNGPSSVSERVPYGTAQRQMGKSWTQLGLCDDLQPIASKRVVPRRGNPPSLYRDGGFLRCFGGGRGTGHLRVRRLRAASIRILRKISSQLAAGSSGREISRTASRRAVLRQAK